MAATVLLLHFYVDVFGLTPQVAGFILFVGTLVDAVGNILASWCSARWHSRLGRYPPS